MCYRAAAAQPFTLERPGHKHSLCVNRCVSTPLEPTPWLQASAARAKVKYVTWPCRICSGISLALDKAAAHGRILDFDSLSHVKCPNCSCLQCVCINILIVCIGVSSNDELVDVVPCKHQLHMTQMSPRSYPCEIS